MTVNEHRCNYPFWLTVIRWQQMTSPELMKSFEHPFTQLDQKVINIMQMINTNAIFEYILLFRLIFIDFIKKITRVLVEVMVWWRRVTDIYQAPLIYEARHSRIASIPLFSKVGDTCRQLHSRKDWVKRQKNHNTDNAIWSSRSARLTINFCLQFKFDGNFILLSFS